MVISTDNCQKLNDNLQEIHNAYNGLFENNRQLAAYINDLLNDNRQLAAYISETNLTNIRNEINKVKKENNALKNESFGNIWRGLKNIVLLIIGIVKKVFDSMLGFFR